MLVSRRVAGVARVAIRGVASDAKPPPASGAAPSTTHFGYQTVPTEDKKLLVAGVFLSVASKYDVMNDAMLLGIHRLWKHHFINKLDPGLRPGASGPLRFLDVAGGTGDIAFGILAHAAREHNDTLCHITVADINGDMLREGEARYRRNHMSEVDPSRIAFLELNGETLAEIPDLLMDMYTIAFGIRNFTDVQAGLNTAHRVLKPGGVFACLEFLRVDNPLVAPAYDLYLFAALPMMGQFIAGDRALYQYLAESIRRFPPQEEFASMVRQAGFYVPEPGFENLTFGVAAIHIGIKM